MIGKHRSKADGRFEVAGEQRNRAGSLSEHAAEGQRVADRPGVVDIALGDAHCPIAKALKPQNPRLKIMRRYPLIVASIRSAIIRSMASEEFVTIAANSWANSSAVRNLPLLR